MVTPAIFSGVLGLLAADRWARLQHSFVPLYKGKLAGRTIQLIKKKDFDFEGVIKRSALFYVEL